MAARAAYIAGFAGTSNVFAERALWNPALRHHGALLREAHDDEADAFFFSPAPARRSDLAHRYLRHRGRRG